MPKLRPPMPKPVLVSLAGVDKALPSEPNPNPELDAAAVVVVDDAVVGNIEAADEDCEPNPNDVLLDVLPVDDKANGFVIVLEVVVADSDDDDELPKAGIVDVLCEPNENIGAGAVAD